MGGLLPEILDLLFLPDNLPYWIEYHTTPRRTCPMVMLVSGEIYRYWSPDAFVDVVSPGRR